MKIFITSDTHFCHKNIIKYTGRPFKTIEEMNEVLIKNWNNKVKKDDLVIHLGDFGLGKEPDIRNIRNKLNGTIILIKGNHDYKITKKLNFLIIEGNLKIGNIVFSHHPLLDIPKGFFNIHGHIHEKESLRGVNISVEKTNYEPISLEELVARLKNL